MSDLTNPTSQPQVADSDISDDSAEVLDLWDESEPGPATDDPVGIPDSSSPHEDDPTSEEGGSSTEGDEVDLDIWSDLPPPSAVVSPRGSSRSHESSHQRSSRSRSSGRSGSARAKKRSPKGSRRPATLSRAEEKARAKRRQTLSRWATITITIAAAAAAALAPASLTGDPIIDVIERVLFAGVVAWVTAHGHRWSWVMASAMFLVPARGSALLMVLAALVLTFWAATRDHRPRVVGSAIGGLLANASLWFTADVHVAVAAACALAGAMALVSSGIGNMRGWSRRAAMIPITAATTVAILAIVGVLVGGLLSASDLTAGSSSARRALAQVEKGETEAARTSLTTAADHLDSAADVLGPSTSLARFVPSLAQHTRAIGISLDESRRITDAADDLLAVTDYEKLRYKGRVDVDRLSELAPAAHEVLSVLEHASTNLAEARSPWLVGPLRTRIDELSTKVTEVTEVTDLASEVLDVAPGLFGGDGDRRYLIVFLTPAELRGGGGFIGSYAEMTARNGRLDLSRSGPIRELIYHGEMGERTISGPADYLRRYGRFEPADYIQDVTFSPNFPSSAQVLAELYPQAGGRAVDGVIGVDPEGLAAMLELTGPVTVEGYDEVLSADNAADLLLREQYIKFGKAAGEGDSDDPVPEGPYGSQQERKDFLAEATKATFSKLTSASLPTPAEIGRALGPAARGRHLQVWSPTAAEQHLFERIDADSSLDLRRGEDGFELAQNNAGNNKLDAYLHREIDYRATIDRQTGALVGTMTVTLSNDVPRPLSELPLEVWSNRSGQPGGTNVTWLSLFTPHNVTAMKINGAPVDFGAEEEAGVNAYDTPFFNIAPNESVTVEFQIEGGLNLTDGYHLRIVPQPVANPDQLTVSVETTTGELVGPDTPAGVVDLKKKLTEPIEISAYFG